MAFLTSGEEKFRFAKSSASQQEREGFYWLGYCYEYSSGCEKDLEKARELYLIAAHLGQVWSMRNLGLLSDYSDIQRWFWWGRAAVLGDLMWFLGFFAHQVLKFNSGSGSGAVVFQIGKALNGHVSVGKRTIFGKDWFFDDRIGPANSAILFYAQRVACRRAVDTWSFVGIRCGVVKDIRVLIGEMIWKTRDLVLYKV
jgi:hypothetical protein